MHWLYFDEHSPALLEAGGFSYDSSVGYNESVGYRAGTSQAFRPLDADRLLELPLHAMDTALFFPSYMNLKPRQARVILDGMIANFVSFGGVFTVNWHDRSIAPERQWDQTYRELLDGLREKGAWFATGTQAIAWFRKRRAARFERTAEGSTSVALDKSHDTLPALEVRRHNSSLRSPEAGPSGASSNLAGSTEIPALASHPRRTAIVS
jgi:hypothetical protein